MIDTVDLMSFKSKSGCCGCRACESICPAGAVAACEDNEGFAYPLINAEKCVNCGLCDKACPMVSIKKNPRSEYAQACFSKDPAVRNSASSGGIFGLLAREMLAAGGVVFGAAFDGELNLRHVDADNLDDLHKLYRSKYIQSDASGAFARVKELLQNHRPVLFAGTPCQVSALNNYLGGEYEGLTTVDFICHGVPSGKMFGSYKVSVEKKRGGRMTSFAFRVKDTGIKHVHSYLYEIEKAGKIKAYKGMFYDNPYYFGFKKYLFLRPSCYSCKYCSPERVSDITLADFWGIEEYLPGLDFHKGVSMVLANSGKGRAAFSAISGNISAYRFEMDIAVRCNHCLSSPTELPPNREELMRAYQSMTFDEFAKRHLMSKKTAVYKMYYALPLFARKFMMKRLKGIGYV